MLVCVYVYVRMNTRSIGCPRPVPHVLAAGGVPDMSSKPAVLHYLAVHAYSHRQNFFALSRRVVLKHAGRYALHMGSRTEQGRQLMELLALCRSIVRGGEWV